MHTSQMSRPGTNNYTQNYDDEYVLQPKSRHRHNRNAGVISSRREQHTTADVDVYNGDAAVCVWCVHVCAHARAPCIVLRLLGAVGRVLRLKIEK